MLGLMVSSCCTPGCAGRAGIARVTAQAAVEGGPVGLPLAVERCRAHARPSRTPPIQSDCRGFTHCRGAWLHDQCYYNGKDDYAYVVKPVVPVLIAGGPVTETRLQALQMVSNAIKAGVRGVFFGQNIWRSPDPAGMVKAMSAIIHDDMAPEEAEQRFLLK